MVEPCKTLEIHPEKIELARTKIIQNFSGSLVEMFKLLSGETRIKILLALSESELCVCDLSEALEMNVSAISHQLKELRQGNMVTSRREGKNIYYSLEQHIMGLLMPALEHIQEDE
ncbi:MAG: ArsR/SmtB family transcription factor [Candidatus Hodarchaeales archaeon]|jgi:ArsR family transcriptional regulator